MRRPALALAVGVALTLLLATAAQAVTVATGGADGTDDKVSDQAYVRHDGGTDPTIQECNSNASDPTPVGATADDLDPNDGGNNKQQNEPAVAVDPTDPTHVVASWNEYCSTDRPDFFLGLGFSTDSGETWVNSLTPGYPSDTSVEGQQSPLFARQLNDSSDPLLAFNSDGDLYTAGIAFSDLKPQDSQIYVTTWAGHPAGGLPYDYQRTAVVGKAGTPPLVGGHFTDKPMMEIDRTGGQYDGNVYVCWSRFTGGGRTRIFFSRSTDGGATFQADIPLSSGKDVQGCDIAVEADGDVYVIWGTRDTPAASDVEGVGFARSGDGGATFSKARQVGAFHRYFPFDTIARDCGDGADLCPSEFVFARIPLEPRVTSDASGGLAGVYVTFNAIDPTTIEESDTSYDSAGPGSGLVGRGVVYVTRSLDNGQTWSDPVKVDDAGGSGHQFFPDVDALDGTLVAVWQDNRGSDYSVQRPIGNTADATSTGATVGTFAAYSTDGTSFTPLGMISSTRQPIQYEMFDARSVPFIGDYNWVSLASTPEGISGYLTWTDNRDVVGGTDPREETQDGFDVHMCVEIVDDVAGPNTCPNAGGFNQNIYGTGIEIAP